MLQLHFYHQKQTLITMCYQSPSVADMGQRWSTVVPAAELGLRIYLLFHTFALVSSLFWVSSSLLFLHAPGLIT